MTKKFKKYWRIFQTHWQGSLEYRGELVLWATIEALPLLAMIILWLSIYKQGSSVDGYSLNKLVSYYILGFIFNRFTNTNIEVEYVDQVRTGKIARFLLKPFSIQQFLVIEEVAWRSLNLIIICIPVLALVYLLTPYSITQFKLYQLPTLILLAIIAFIINSLISMILLGISFFMDQGRTLSHFKWMLEGIFSGALLPLSAYPEWLQKYTRILPFQLRFAVPVEYTLGHLSSSQLATSIFIAFTWIAILFITMKVLWRYAIVKFTAVGN